MKVGGKADYLVTAKSAAELVSSVNLARNYKVNFQIIGFGSNILVGDKGFRGLVIKNRADKIIFTNKGKIDHGNLLSTKGRVIAESGVITNLLVRKTIEQGLSGLEYFLGMPGTLGGAVFNNSHFQTEYLGNFVDSVTTLGSNGKIKIYTHDEMKFTYDSSIFQKNRDTILDVCLALSPDDPKKIWKKATYYSAYRSKSQPLDLPSSGCIFKNVKNYDGIFSQQRAGMTSAGYLIDQAGLKGTRVGNAMVSSKHASFIVNLGGATSKEIIELIKIIRKKVKDKFGVVLALEVFKVGEF
jgi:UDP-N-acetylmuramate dehydrogenase